VPLSLHAFPSQFVPEEVLHLFSAFRFAGDRVENVGCRTAADSQYLGRNDDAGARIDRHLRQPRIGRHAVLRHRISGGQVRVLVSRETDGQSQPALASSSRIYANQYVTNFRSRAYRAAAH